MQSFSEQLRRMTGKRVYIDTNILIYFFNKQEKYFSLIWPLLEQCANRQIFGVVSELVVAEILVQPYRQRNIEAIAHIKTFFGQKHFLEVCEPPAGFMTESAVLAGERGMKLIDAMHFHIAISTHCDFFLTHDSNFKSTHLMEVVQLQDYFA